jgi:hypothetical protein
MMSTCRSWYGARVVAPLAEPLLLLHMPHHSNSTGEKGPWRLWVSVCVVCVSGLLLGYELCVIATVLTSVQRDLDLCPECVGDGSCAESIKQATPAQILRH